ncbi:MAG: bifunctional 3,4-dihydroxy-2-butanone-4-phosphate synthase/GTP cyclohydrolase II [Bdellovibrionota bacterium]
MPIQRIEEGLEDIRQGKIVILVDDEDRENEGDFMIAAEKVTPDAINFMAKYGRGLICLTVTEDRARQLHLEPMVKDNQSPFQTAFTVSIEARKGVTTGISAHDRATTILTAVANDAKAEDLVRPGHIFPLIAKRGGVLVRTGQTEGSVDLCRLAGVKPAGVICEIMNDDGTMARRPDLDKIAERFGLKILSVADLIKYRVAKERLVYRYSEARVPTIYGEFNAVVYHNDLDRHEHVAFVKGDVSGGEPVLVRVHSSCVTGDIFGSLRCDCGDQLHEALRMIDRDGKGVLLYLMQEGRGIGLGNKLKAYNLQDEGHDTVEANVALGFPPDLREYGVGAQILVDLGIKKMRIMTNNPRKIVGVEGYGLEVVERVPIEIPPHEHNVRYMQTKRDKLGHILQVVSGGGGDTPGGGKDPSGSAA